MKRFWFLAVLMLLSSSAHAGGYSFSIGGHRIHIESSRYCRSTSCGSVSISGIHRSRGKSDRDDDDIRDTAEPVRAPAPPVVATVPVAPPASSPAVPPAAAAPPAAAFKPAAT